MAGHTEELALLRVVFDALLKEHPLPWRVERDWSFEVTASDGTIIAKCAMSNEAGAIITFAQERHSEQKQRAA